MEITYPVVIQNGISNWPTIENITLISDTLVQFVPSTYISIGVEMSQFILYTGHSSVSSCQGRVF